MSKQLKQELSAAGIDPGLVSLENSSISLRHQSNPTLCKTFLQLNLPQICSVDLTFNDFSVADIHALVEGLTSNTTVTELNMAFNSLNDASFGMLCQGLVVNSSLKSLILKGNSITNQGMQTFQQALNGCQSSITSLDLSSNKISNEGVIFLAQSLQANLVSLTQLNLAFNSTIKSDGAAIFSSVLARHPAIQVLDVRGLVDGLVSQEFALGICSSTTLIHVDMWNVGQTQTSNVFEQMGKMIQENAKRRLATVEESRKQEREQRILQQQLQLLQQKQQLEDVRRLRRSSSNNSDVHTSPQDDHHAQPMLNNSGKRSSMGALSMATATASTSASSSKRFSMTRVSGRAGSRVAPAPQDNYSPF